jgi:hypothetical protein
MTQDPGSKPGEMDLSPDLDYVVLYSSQTMDADVEADVIRGVLDAAGIACMVSTSPLSMSAEVRVTRTDLPEAQRLLAEAQQAGPEAAVEAEAEGEGQGAAGAGPTA